MPREIVINSGACETRVALVEDQKLVEVFIERTLDRGIAGNIYKGRVTRVLPGLQAAFVDIGVEKAAFLHARDLDPELGEEYIDSDSPVSPEPDGEVGLAVAPLVARRPPIEERLKKGNEILVQVTKEPIGSKGARVTGVISIPGRHLVLMPGSQHVGVSRRIEGEAERARLTEIVMTERPPQGGFIIRTACEGLSKREVQGDLRFLGKVWARILEKSERVGAPALLHYDMDVTLRTVRDLFTADTQRLVVDNPREYQRVLDFVDTVMPRLKSRVELYDGAEPAFEHFRLEQQLERALDRKVWLKSGGYIVIDHTEALTVVDVNTGRYVGKTNQEDTILKTNLEAVTTIVEQLRLRNIGGIIVIDLIDMESRAHRREVFEALAEALKKDKKRSQLLPISELGLIEMTRKRSRESLAQLLCTPCPRCDGKSQVKAASTVAYQAVRRIEREARLNTALVSIAVRVHPQVAEFLRKRESRALQLLQSRLNVAVEIAPAADLDESEVEVFGVEAPEADRKQVNVG